MAKPPVLLIALLACTAVVAAACGSSGDKSSAAAPDETTQSEPSAEAVTTDAAGAPSTATLTKGISANLKTRPKIAQPDGEPPATLQKIDIVKGKGRTARTGDQVTVQYVGANWSNGQEFDASWNRGQPFAFPLGGGQVIPGWDKGVAGMKVGGRRLLVIPPDEGYGPQGTPDGSIPPNETLLFVVDLEKVAG